jgi:ArsR family transcriptional regulator, arsenate/arsenite/antimonite-responsive transcriptional repressor
MTLLKIAQPHARAAAAQGFHALADQTRLRILDLLRDGERCVCELQDWLGMSQSALSFHLKTMKEAGLLLDRRQGRWVYYRLNPPGLAALEEALAGLIKNF